jgi:transmembrane sensor
MGLTPEQDMKIAEEAAVWVQRLRGQDTPELQAAFSEWARQGTRHVEEFLFAQAIWKEFDRVDPTTLGRLRAADADSSVVAFPKQAPVTVPASNGRRYAWRVASAIAAAVVAALVWTQLVPFERQRTHVTEVGEQKTLKLADGSLIRLNAVSRVVVDFDDSVRLVRLAEGEALFTVAHDTTRPFIVVTDTARVRAVGTQFNVYRNDASGTRVAVIEGVVQVSTGNPTATPSPLQLKAGDEAAIDHGRIQKAARPDIERAVSWTHRKLMFPGNELREIVEQFNRYNDKPIRIETPELDSRRMSGVFDADDPAPLLDHLASDPRVEVIRGNDAIVIRRKAQ